MNDDSAKNENNLWLLWRILKSIVQYVYTVCEEMNQFIVFNTSL